MKNQELRSSLIKSGIIMILFIFFIYSFAAVDSGGVAGTIGSIFSGILFLIGLALAVTVSILVMFGIYFGILYMYNPETCKKTYDEFKTKVAESAKSLSSTCSSKSSLSKTVIPPKSDKDQSPLQSYQDRLDSQLSGLQNSVASLEKILNTVSSSVVVAAEEIAKLDERANSVEEKLESKATTDSVDEAAKKLACDITALQGSVKPLADNISELEITLSTLSSKANTTDKELQEDPTESALSEIKDELATMKKTIESLSNQPPQETTAAEETSHRILSYFSRKSDTKTFIALVSEAVAKEMTYAQVDTFINDSLSAEASEVIAAHPSLTKDYIRTCRQND
jgi:predicted  nucleic acid-binding Zn-ribbon protein